MQMSVFFSRTFGGAVAGPVCVQDFLMAFPPNALPQKHFKEKNEIITQKSKESGRIMAEKHYQT